MVLMTSGSTGPPKGVLCPHSQMLWWGTCVGQALELSPDDTLLTSLPLHHTNALGALMQAWLAGAHIAVADRFSSRSYWEQVATAGASVGYLLGGMASRVLDQTPPTNHRLRRVLAPGITSREHDILRDRFGVTALEGFGSTETNYAIGTALSDVRPGWMGKARPGFDVKLQSTDEISSTRHDGIVGELLLKTHLPGAFSNGYLGQTPDAPGLWRRTGDLVVEENGWYRFVGRRHDIIRVKGENVRAQDVETILNMHNSVRTSAVYTLGNAEQEIAAAVVPSSTELDLTNLVNHVRNQLPRWAVPRYLTVVEELPETETGKVDKPALMRRGIVPETVDLAPTHPTHRGAT